jgi:hypothetical protein
MSYSHKGKLNVICNMWKKNVIRQLLKSYSLWMFFKKSVVLIINLEYGRERILCRIAIKANWMWTVFFWIVFFLLYKYHSNMFCMSLYIRVFCLPFLFNLNGDPPGAGINSRPHQTEKWWKKLGRWWEKGMITKHYGNLDCVLR